MDRPCGCRICGQKAYEAAANPAANNGARTMRQMWYARSEQVRQYVLARASCACEACDAQAPFKRRDGTPYLEPHHTTRLADEGLDHLASVEAIGPTCHRRIHSGEDGADWNAPLMKRIAAKEQANTAVVAGAVETVTPHEVSLPVDTAPPA